MPSCTTGRSRPTTRSSTPTRTTCAASTTRCSPSTPARCGSASPGTTSSTSRTPGCSPASAACATAVEFEMLLGMAQGQVEAVAREVGHVLLYVPVVRPDEFDVAISYLVRRLEENASSENFLSAAFELADEPAMFERERDRFLASIDRAARRRRCAPARTAGRIAPRAGRAGPSQRAERRGRRTAATNGVRTAGDRRDGIARRSDAGRDRHRPHRGRGGRRRHRAARAGRRRSMMFGGDAVRRDRRVRAAPGRRPRGRRARLPQRRRHRPVAARRTATGRATSWPASTASTAGDATIAAALVTDADALEAIVARVRDAAAGLGRAAREPSAPPCCEAAARALEARRGELIEVAASETGKVFAEADVEVSEAVDFANYYAATARELDRVSGAVFEPVAAHRRHPAVELPDRDPRRRRARRARRGIGRRLQARAAGAPLRGRASPRRCGRPASRAMCWRSSTSTRARSGSGSSRTPTSTG